MYHRHTVWVHHTPGRSLACELLKCMHFHEYGKKTIEVQRRRLLCHWWKNCCNCYNSFRNIKLELTMNLTYIQGKILHYFTSPVEVPISSSNDEACNKRYYTSAQDLQKLLITSSFMARKRAIRCSQQSCGYLVICKLCKDQCETVNGFCDGLCLWRALVPKSLY